jgi:hypothetical protein
MFESPLTSSLLLRLLQRGLVVLFLLAAGTVPADHQLADDALEAFIHRTAAQWCAEHGKREDVQAVVVDVRFRPEPPLFSEGEGVVVAPLAVELPRGQRVVDVATQPAHLRKLEVQGVTAVAWEYGGRVHREMRFAGMALVERPGLVRVTPPEKPTFDGLAADQRPEALARAADLEEHGLHKCAAFPEWARSTAGPGPYTEQVLRLVRAVAKPYKEGKREPDDVCAAIREGRLTPHRGQVAVVMAARELGIPAYGFSSATPRGNHLVGTYTDQAGWMLLDVENPDGGWFTGGPPLLTRAPLLGGFGAGQHDFWTPAGAAYQKMEWVGVSAVSRTAWRGRLTMGGGPANTTEARVVRLSEVCR